MKHFFFLIFILCLLVSCRSSDSSMKSVDYRQLARAGLRLGFDIEPKDDWNLFMESASWIGTPYRSGGNGRSGVDCSGLNIAIYNHVYGKKLNRKSLDQKEKDCKRISRSELRSGDLVFFSTGNSRKKVGHTGIYLKDGKFIHASSSRGVIVSSLDEDYYRKHWICGGRVKQ
ncbi:MAG: C40 family peptidase [Prevotellaceae bacterium]|nr:C40 family peptidase [Prevotellaceae bacterium]